MGRKHKDRERSNSIEILDERCKVKVFKLERLSATVNTPIFFFFLLLLKFSVRVLLHPNFCLRNLNIVLCYWKVKILFHDGRRNFTVGNLACHTSENVIHAV